MIVMAVPRNMLSPEHSGSPGRRTPWKIAALLASIAAIALTLRALPAGSNEVRNILHHLNFAPLILTGMLFGWRAALMASLVAFAAEGLNLPRTIRESALDAVDLSVELGIFGVAGVIAGILSDRSRRQRTRLEQAASELQRVYRELSENVEQMKKAERLSAAGQLSASLAHEIRNPLASISGAAGLLKRSYVSHGEHRGTSVECLDIIERESHRLNKLLTGFLEFARPRAPRFQKADIGELVQSVISLAGHSAHTKLTLQPHVQPDLPLLECDPEQLKQVLLNLLMNAIQASPGGGTVEVLAGQQDGQAVIAVRDEGEGILPAEQGGTPSRMFEPFFTTKENGSGLGLAISAKIVEQHGGTIQAIRNPERGMTFLVYLPFTQEKVARLAEVAS